VRREIAAVGMALALAALPGCAPMRIGARNVGAFFSWPKEVDKIRDPVRKDARLAVLWVGHATALIQIDDKIILTDPIFTSTAGQLARRIVEPGLDPDRLPMLDAVVVSHMHSDHLSLGSLGMLEKKVKMLLLPRGGASCLTDFDFPALELGRWQAWEKDGLRVTAAPVDHVGWRYGIDSAWMTESFTGYVIEYHGIKVYFGGDSAYDQKVFVEAAERFPNLDLALLPIAPMEPRELMRRTHMDPHEAMQAFIDLKAKRFVPIHFETFAFSAGEPGEERRALEDAKRTMRLGPTRVVAPLQIGEQRVFWKRGEEDPVGKIDDTPKPPPAPAPKKEEPRKNEIPDDDKLD
jgi:N-acyl-phosphatidylethanolamine-hydrolysing phospholipase D